MVACGESQPAASVDADTLLPDPGAAGSGSGQSGERSRATRVPPVATTAEGALVDWCLRAGADEDAQARTMRDIGLGYLADQERRCGALTRTMNDAQRSDWANYLIAYTSVMAGCLQLSEPPPDGIRAFGPANTAAVGAADPDLHRGDIALLIELYVSLFAASLNLDGAERALVEAQLWVSVGGRLSEEAPDAVAPGSSDVVVCLQAADAGAG
jgi:hypothetical protein